LIRTINALLHAVGLDASLIGTLLLSLSTIAGTEISNPSWVNFQSAGGSVFNQRQQTGQLERSGPEPPAVREYLEALDEEALAETLPKRLSLTDPQARWTAAPGGPAFYAYSTNYLIDTEQGVIVDVELTPAHRMAEVESTKIMIGWVEAQFDIKPERLIGDTAYGTASMLAWMVEE